MSSKYDGRSSVRWRKIRKQVLESSDQCWLCGKPGADTVDHVLPLSIYPELARHMCGLRPAHNSCNSRKGPRLDMGKALPMPRSRGW